MANKLLAFLTKLATGRWVIVFLLLVVAFNFALRWIYPSFPTLDIQSSYSPEKAYQLLDSYGEAGRQEYLVTELTVDLVYPILLALLFGPLMLYLFRRVFPADSVWQRLPLLAPLAMLVDYLENTSIVIMLLNYPRRLDLLARAANLFTVGKFGLGYLELILILLGLLGWLGKTLYAILKKRTGEMSHEK